MKYAISEGSRDPFPRISANTTMQLLVTDFSGRVAVIIHNEGPETVYVGATGQSTDLWMGIGPADTFIDDYSMEDWWVYTPTSSGTVSGYSVKC